MNPLKADLDTFLSNIVSTQALFFQTATHLQNHKATLIKNFEGYDPSTFIMGSTMAIGDLTGATDCLSPSYPGEKFYLTKVKSSR